MAGFNLVYEPWVPVTVQGAAEEVSLLWAVTHAHEIDGLGIEDPLEAVALLRQVLLPVVVDALGAPRSEAEWARRWQEGRMEGKVLEEYLRRHESRFDLFDEDRPFAQVAGLRAMNGETKPVSLLLPAAASGNSVPLFSPYTEATPPSLSPAKAARALLATHSWDTAAIKSGAEGDPQAKGKGKTTGNPTGPVGSLGVTVPLGDSLARTLMLNTPILEQGLREPDRPQWRQNPQGPTWRVRPVEGLLDLWTFQSRRVRLVPDTEPGGATSVSQVVLTAGDRLDQVPEIEPHTMWRRDPKPSAKSAPRRPVRHQPGKATWRGLGSLLAAAGPTREGISSTSLLSQIAALRMNGHVSESLPLQVLTVGIAYGNQSAVVEDVVVDLIPLPVVALGEDEPVRALLHEVVAQAEDLRRAANDLGDDIRRAAGADKVAWDQGFRPGEVLVHRLTQPVERMLAGLQRDPDRVDEAADAWQTHARALALAVGEEVLSAAPPETFLGREHENGSPPHRLSTAEARYRKSVYSLFPQHDAEPVGGPA